MREICHHLKVWENDGATFCRGCGLEVKSRYLWVRDGNLRRQTKIWTPKVEVKS